MADIRLAKPVAGTSQTVACEPEARFIFDFPTDEATLSRSGDNLVITFEDGSTLQLENFYTAYSSENMPSFSVEGTEISGEDFFTAMNEPDLMPAAGPGRAGAQSNGNRFHDYVTSDLLDGLDRLGGLDIGWPGGDVSPDTDGAAAGYGDINFPVTITPGESGDLDDDIPVIDNPDNPYDGNADPSAGRSVLNVNEAGLRDASSVTASGHMLVDAPDGVASIVIGGLVVFDGSALTGQVVPTDEGYLEVTGFNAASGRLDYTYHLTQATQEHSGEGADKIAHDLAVTVTDRDGSTDTGVVTVVITDDVPVAYDNAGEVTENHSISGNVLTESDGTGRTDSFGADGGSGVSWNLSGYTEAEGSMEGSEEDNKDGTYTVTDGVYTVYTQYGVATLHPDGSYTFAAKENAKLNPGDSAKVELGYTITDSDGDSADAKLTITINGDINIPIPPEEDPSDIVVDEGALPNGSGQHESHGYTGTGSFTVDLNGEDGTVTLKYGSGQDAPTITLSLINNDQFSDSWLSSKNMPILDSPTTFVVRGVTVTVGKAIQLQNGSWQINYSYELKEEQAHTGKGSAGAVGENDALSDSIDITVTDATGDTATSSLTVTVHDDGPVAVADDVTLTEAVAQAGGSGANVLSNDVFGADAPADKTVTSIEGGTLGQPVKGQYGELTLKADGSYTYQLTPGVDVPKGSTYTETFTYTITDTDGDTSEATLTITIKGDGRTPSISVPATAKVYESGLDEGGSEASTAKETTSGEITLTLNGEAATVTIGGREFAVDADGNATIAEGGESIDTGEGTLVVTGISGGKVSYTYTLKENQTHAEGLDNNTLTDEIAISVTDSTHDTASGTLVITIVDDVPSISIDTEASGSYGSMVTGSVDMAFGADGEKSVTVSLNGGNPVTGEEGEDGNYTFTFVDGHTLTLNGETGEFSYNGVPASGTGTSYTFTFTVEDNDGDIATATTTATLAPKASYTGKVTSSDNELLQTDPPSHSVELPDVPEIEKILSGTEVKQDGNVIGKFELSGGKLFFVQSRTYTHSDDSNSATFPHVLTIKDIYGNEHLISVDITIEDSLPRAENDFFELKEHDDASGNVLENDTMSADGTTLVTKVIDVDGNLVGIDDVTEVKGKLGTLSINAYGSYTYKLYDNITIPENSILREEFTYTITDADGDSSTAALTILVGKGTVHVKESGIGLDANGKEIEILGIDSVTGSVEGNVNDVTVGSPTYTDPQLAQDEKLSLTVEKKVDEGDIITIYTNYGDLVVDKSTGKYTFTLDDDAANPLPNGFEIRQGFEFSTTVEGSPTTQEVVVVIEGTNDAGQLSEAGKGGSHNNQLWIDAKAEGADSVERPYDATNHPNLGKTDSGDWSSDLNQSSNGTARPTGWLPFTLEDPDVGDSLTFHAVYNNAGNSAGSSASMAGDEFVSYQAFMDSMDTAPLSIALSVEWGKFQQNFSSDQLDTMKFFRNEYGIFAITNEAVELSANKLEGAQYWLAFLVDSDAEVIRNMAEGTGTETSYGKILNFSFQVTDATGNTVKTQTGSGSYADINHVLVHVYGSNDTPEIKLDGKQGTLVVHDDDISISGSDKESHTMTISYDGKNYTTALTGYGTIEFDDIQFKVSKDTQDGTNYTLSEFQYKNENSWSALSGSLAITITDARGNAAIYHVDVQNGQLVATSSDLHVPGTNESENIYGGNGSDTLNGGEGNDSLWGLDGNDTLHGDAGNDRLYGGAGNDTLHGDAGMDVLVGGSGNDYLDGGDGNDVLIGDGQTNLQSIVEETVNAETFHDFLTLKSPSELENYIGQYETLEDRNDTLNGGSGDDLLFGMGGDDALYGGDGNDMLFGGSGNDYLDGGAGQDTVYAGSGNDLIVYDGSDYLIDGGSGLDVMLGDSNTPSLDDLLGQTQKVDGKPLVNDVEVLIRGNDLSLTSLDDLRKLDISITHEDGVDRLELGNSWSHTGTEDHIAFYTNNDGLTVEIDTSAMTQQSEAEVQQTVFILNNSQGA